MPAVSGYVPRSISHARTFALHLWAFVLPLITLTFWLTGPHSWWAALLWVTPILVLVYIDNHAPPDHRQPPHAHGDMVVDKLAGPLRAARLHGRQHARQDTACLLWLHAITQADNAAHALMSPLIPVAECPALASDR